MNGEMLRTLALIAFCIAAASLIVGAILWFTLNIRNVIGFLSGRNVKRATESLSTGGAGRSLYKRPNKTSSQKPAAKDEVKLRKTAPPPVDATVPLDMGTDEGTVPLGEGTALLDSSGEVMGTALLDGDDRVEGTTLLADDDRIEGTTLLSAQKMRHSDFVITESIVMVHTDEDIKFLIV